MRYFTHDMSLEGKPSETKDLERWQRWFETTNRTSLSERVGPARVELVFRGCDEPEPGAELKLWTVMVSGRRDFETITGRLVPLAPIFPCETPGLAHALYDLIVRQFKVCLAAHEAELAEASRKPGCKEGIHDWMDAEARCRRCDITSLEVLAGKTPTSSFLEGMEEIE